MTRHPCQAQWDAALRRDFSENIARCRKAKPTYSVPDRWLRCVMFLEGLLKDQPERIAALKQADLTTVFVSGSAEAKTVAMAALQHASVSSRDADITC